MVEGFWILEIQPPPITTGGVVCFISGRILGGDNGFTWVGNYSFKDNLLKGRILVQNFDPDIKSVLGISGDYEMYVSGLVAGEVIMGTAIVANQPQHNLALRLVRKVDLSPKSDQNVHSHFNSVPQL